MNSDSLYVQSVHINFISSELQIDLSGSGYDKRLKKVKLFNIVYAVHQQKYSVMSTTPTTG